MADQTKTNVKGSDIAKKAAEVMSSVSGTAYKFGGKSTDGFDCSGFVTYVLKSLFTENPSVYEMTASQFASSNLFETVTSPSPGCIICFSAKGSSPAHMGIVQDSEGWIGSQSSTGVAKVKFSNPYWSGRTHTYRRLKTALSDTAAIVQKKATRAA